MYICKYAAVFVRLYNGGLSQYELIAGGICGDDWYPLVLRVDKQIYTLDIQKIINIVSLCTDLPQTTKTLSVSYL